MSPVRDRGGPTACIFDVMRYSTHDGPGIRTAVFFKGCSLSCAWCHNPESQAYRPDVLYFEERCRRCGDCVAACPEHAIEAVNGVPRTSAACRRCGECIPACAAEARRIAGHPVTVAELMEEIEKDSVFFEESGGGVTLSGGEPLSQPRFVAAFLRACREHGIPTAIETCGFAPASVFLAVAPLADLILFDLKLMDDASHRRYTGVSNAGIHTNLEALTALGRPVTVRIPVVPGINDGAEEVWQFAAYLAQTPARAVELLPYHGIGAAKYQRLGLTYTLPVTPEPLAADLERFAAVLRQAGLQVKIRG